MGTDQSTAFKVYEPTQDGIGERISPLEEGYYKEILIQNHSNSGVVVIKPTNERVVIEPQKFPVDSGAHVRIVIREHNGSRINKQHQESKIDTRVYHIPLLDLELDPPYIQELGIKLCLDTQMNTTNHPAAGYQTYRDALNRTINAICTEGDPVTVRVFANDPEGKTKKLYWWFCDCMHVIDATKTPDDMATVTICITKGKFVIKRRTFNMQDFFGKEAGAFVMSGGDILHIGATEDEVVLALDNEKAMRKRNIKTIEERLQERDRRHAKALEEQKVQQQHELQKKDAEIDKLVFTIKQQENTIKRQEAELNNWHGLGEFHKHKSQIEKSTASVETAKATADKAKLGASNERLKSTLEFVKVAVPIISMIMTIIIAKK